MMQQKPAIKKRRLRKKSDTVIIPDEFLSETFLDAWDIFMELRKDKKGKDTEYAQGLILDKIILLSGSDHDVAVELIQQAIEAKWIGIFPLRKIDNKNTTTTVYSGSVKAAPLAPAWKPIQLSHEEEKKMQHEAYDELDKFIRENKKFPATYQYVQVFHHLKTEGLIKDSVEQMKIFMNEVVERLKSEHKRLLEKKSASADVWKNILANGNSLKLEARKERAIKYFEEKFNIKVNRDV